jgi:hypothetical protein
MKFFTLCAAMSAVCALHAESAATHTVIWDAPEAFADAGLLLNYQEMHGEQWVMNAVVHVAFAQGTSDYAPQSVLRPEACAWLCYGAEVQITTLEHAKILSVEFNCLSDYPFVADVAEASQGTMECHAAKATWSGEPTEALTVSQCGTFSNIFEDGARVGVKSIAVTYCRADEENSAVAELTAAELQAPAAEYDLLGRRIADGRNYRGIRVVNGRLVTQ